MLRKTVFIFLTAASSFFVVDVTAGPILELPPLPYAIDSLEPMISKRTLEFHHGEHHAKYIATTNSMIAGTELEGKDLEEIMLASYGKNQALYNNAAQAYNHAFYWTCMNPHGGSHDGKGPAASKYGDLVHLIKKSFGTYANFEAEFTAAGNSAFGSGWAWLVHDKSTGKLFVMKTIGADNPMALNKDWTPLLTMEKKSVFSTSNF
jgi:Fe-Mn family superoxide dismutase